MILIDMKMPKSCCDCDFCYDDLECMASFHKKDKPIFFDRKAFDKEPFEFCKERHPRCPLEEVEWWNRREKQ